MTKKLAVFFKKKPSRNQDDYKDYELVEFELEEEFIPIYKVLKEKYILLNVIEFINGDIYLYRTNNLYKKIYEDLIL